MEVFCLPKYGDLAAATRQRFLQYRPYLEAIGIALDVHPLLGNGYLANMYQGLPADRIDVLTAYWRRYRAMGRAQGAALTWLHYEALPYMPWALERRVFSAGLPVVFDMDDAIFHRYNGHSNAGVRLLMGNKIDRIIRAARIVFAGNCYLADHAKVCGAQEIQIVPTVLDTSHYVARPESQAAVPGQTPVIGWIGSPSTWSEYMVPMMPLLTDIAENPGARLLAVGSGRGGSGYEALDHRTWSEAREIADIHDMDIGIMPLSDTPWARGKCGYKLIQYMACGLPVVASPVGVNTEIVTHGETGFLADTPQEWRTALETLLADPELRKRMGAAGRARVEKDYCLQVWGPRVAQLLADAAR